MKSEYIGHPSQMYGVQEMRLVGGKGDDMRMLCVRNASGLEFWISADRCADIVRFSFKGDNFSYISPCGYVSPKFYDSVGNGFLKSFTAGFFTTCGLTCAGAACTDEGEELPMHGTISNIPCENIRHWIEKDAIHIKAEIRDAVLFGHQLLLEREYICPLEENVIYLQDTIKNIGVSEAPIQIIYHCNMGYPLLSENAKVTIPAEEVVPRDAHSADGFENYLVMEKPQRGYVEKCYFHTMHGETTVSIYNDDIQKGLAITYDAEKLKYFTEWKMMGEKEYALGLEPGNCLPTGRKAMREAGMLEFLAPEEEKIYQMKFKILEG